MTNKLATATEGEHNEASSVDTSSGVRIAVAHDFLIEQIKSNKELHGQFDVCNMTLADVSIVDDSTVFKFINKVKAT